MINTGGSPLKQFKTIGIQVTEAQLAALEAAADRFGLGIGPYMRMTALQAAASAGFHHEQPRAD